MIDWLKDVLRRGITVPLIKIRFYTDSNGKVHVERVRPIWEIEPLPPKRDYFDDDRDLERKDQL